MVIRNLQHVFAQIKFSVRQVTHILLAWEIEQSVGAVRSLWDISNDGVLGGNYHHFEI